MLARPVTRCIKRVRLPFALCVHPGPRSSGVRKYATEEQTPIRRVHPKKPFKEYNVGSQEASSDSTDLGVDESYIVIHDKGKKYPVNMLFLRDACTCRQCVDEHSGQKRFDTVNIPQDVCVEKIAMSNTDHRIGDRRRIFITWANDVPGWENHTSSFPLAFIKTRHRGSRTETKAFRKLWNSKSTDLLVPVDYLTYMNDDEALGALLTRLHYKGLALVNNVPEDETSVEKIVERIGNLRDTFYGRTWDVRDKPQAENVAYTSQHLGLHMDLMYMKQPPGFQFLHCLKSSCEGGESIFSDAFRAASIMHHQAPGDFKTLAEFKTGYHYRRNGKYYKDAKPTIELGYNDHGSPVTDRNGQPVIEHVNWSPPFQSRFPPMNDARSTGMDFQRYHAAARRFSDIVNHQSALIEYRLNPGECVIFNNRRVLHGRKAFKSSQGERWLKGAYLNTDEFTSALRASANDRAIQKYRKRRTSDPTAGAEEVADENETQLNV